MRKNLPLQASPLDIVDNNDIGVGKITAADMATGAAAGNLAAGDVTNTMLHSNSVGSTALKSSALAWYYIGATSGSGAHAQALNGTKVGDVVSGVISLLTITAANNVAAGAGNITSKFETTISVADQIQQTATGDYTKDTLLVLIIPKGTAS